MSIGNFPIKGLMIRSSQWEVFRKEGIFLPGLHTENIGWPVLNEKVILTGDYFFPSQFTRDKNGFILPGIQVLWRKN